MLRRRQKRGSLGRVTRSPWVGWSGGVGVVFLASLHLLGLFYVAIYNMVN